LVGGIAVNNNTVTVTVPANVNFTSGDAKFSENVYVKYDAVADKFDVIKDTAIPVTTNMDSAALTALAFALVGGSDGITSATVLSENGGVITVADQAGNVTVYHLVCQ